MTSDERNFRSSYYEKVGCRGVEEKKSLEMLMKDKSWDKIKLKQFCLRFTVPAAYRNLVWKVLFDILPVFPDIHNFVWEQRTAQYDDLMYALDVMELINEKSPRNEVLYAAWQLETGRQVPIVEPDSQFSVEASFKPIAVTLSELYGDEIDVYWLAKGFCGVIQSFQKEMTKLHEIFRTMLEKEDDDVFNHLLKMNAMDVLPLTKWFNCCFAGVLDDTSLTKIWDKIVSGAPKILSYVAVMLVITLRRNILRARTAEEVLKCVTEMPEECEEVVANKAIELWQYYGALPQGDPLTKK